MSVYKELIVAGDKFEAERVPECSCRINTQGS